MTFLSTVAAGRRAAEARMVSFVLVRRPTGETTTDADGFDVPEWEVVYDGPFRLGGAERGGSGSRNVRVGDVELTLATRVGHFPANTEGLSDGDLIEVVDGENVGVVLRIVEADWQDQATARRVPVIAAPRPEGWP